MSNAQRFEPTSHLASWVPCPWCRGTGKHPAALDGWYVDYHYQDGHEQCGPFIEEEAIRRVTEHRDPAVTVTLIGPDGRVWRQKETT